MIDRKTGSSVGMLVFEFVGSVWVCVCVSIASCSCD